MNSAGAAPVIAVVGPTGVGKSRLSMELASELGADIVAADSRQIYRYMDIGTVKPSTDDRARVRHYMLDLVEPSERYSAMNYREEAQKVLNRIAAQSRIALVVGGTGFYIRSLLDGLSLPEVPPNLKLREELRCQAENKGSAALHAQLALLDPRSAERIHANNLPRIIRALEIVEGLGVPVPANPPLPAVNALYIGLTMDRHVLRSAVDQRISVQIDNGFVDEVRELLAMGYTAQSPGLQGFGYSDLLAYVTRKVCLDEAVNAYRSATYRYIRRQLTWFRSDTRIFWIQSDDDALPKSLELIRAWIAEQHPEFASHL